MLKYVNKHNSISGITVKVLGLAGLGGGAIYLLGDMLNIEVIVALFDLLKTIFLTW
jgi:hypothetical protein